MSESMPKSISVSQDWFPIVAESAHPLSSLAYHEIAKGVWLIAEHGRRARGGVGQFRLLLKSSEFGTTISPVVTGHYDLSNVHQPNWIEITRFIAHLPLTDGRYIDLEEEITLEVIKALGSVIPPGGSLVVEYESPIHSTTELALSAGVPPVASPLGGMLFAAGCGSAFRDRASASGGQAGRRRLQGFRTSNTTSSREEANAMLIELEEFIERSKELDWHVQAQSRPIAEATISALREILSAL